MLTTGCATVTGGTTQKVSLKTQKDTADVAGADCVLANSKGTYTVTTPGTVSVHRAKDDLSIKCTKDGETDAITAVKSTHRTGAMVGNILLLGVASVALEGIDRANGAAYAYPDNVTVSFGSQTEPPLVPSATKSDASTTPSAANDSTTTTGAATTQAN
jgi:hypothetical protein